VSGRTGIEFPEIPGLVLFLGFITEPEETLLVESADRGRWRREGDKRVQKFWDADFIPAPDPAMEAVSTGLPSYTGGVVSRIVSEGIFSQPPYRLIVSEYQPGQGMGAHVDCLQRFRNSIGVLSLISTYPMNFQHVSSGTRLTVDLPPRSLLFVEGEARYDWTHGIAGEARENEPPRGRRISLAFSCAQGGKPCAP
jgi:alkylated DNA repair dioxygenase AlkB